MTLLLIIRFRIAAGREDEWERFVAKRSKKLAKQDGFDRMYLLRPTDGDTEYRVVSWWDELDKPEAWIRKEMYEYSESEEHAGIVVGPPEHEVLEIVREF